MLEFDWDESNLQHIARHGVCANEVEYTLQNPTLDVNFETVDGEERFSEIGSTRSGRVLMVISTWRGARIRVVTAFDAPKNTALEYYRFRSGV